MRPNLSVEKIAGALAVLGTGVLMAACGADKPANTPVNSTEAPAASSAAKPADGSCGAHKPGEGSCGAKPSADAPKAADTAAASTTAPATTPDTKAADTKAADAKPTDAKPVDPKKKPAAPAADPKKKAGGASCGAGTCSGKK